MMSSNIKVLHIPARAPYARHLTSDCIDIVNDVDNSSIIPRDTTFGWFKNFISADENNWEVFDVLHVHTVELTELETFASVLDQCTQKRKGILFTFHDTRPMFSKDIESFRKSIGIIASSDAVLTTLTPSAADILSEMASVDRRRINVVPHGNVLPLNNHLWAEPRSQGLESKIFSIHGGFRPNKSIFPAALNFAFGLKDKAVKLEMLTRGIGNKEFFESQDVRESLRVASESDKVNFHFHPFPSDQEVAEFVFGSDCVILPYLWGAHSGQMELAFDLGIPVVASNVGHYDEQYDFLKDYVPEPIWVDWADGNEYQYGSRILAAMLQAYENNNMCSLDQRREFLNFRILERREILDLHLNLYHEAWRMNQRVIKRDIHQFPPPN